MHNLPYQLLNSASNSFIQLLIPQQLSGLHCQNINNPFQTGILKALHDYNDYHRFQQLQLYSLHLSQQRVQINNKNTCQDGGQDFKKTLLSAEENNSFQNNEEVSSPLKMGVQEKKDEVLRAKIIMMVKFFIENSGKKANQEIQANKTLYASSTPILSELFDKLTERYASTSKCREDMVRFALRKALSFLRESLKEQYNLSSKAASMLMCQRYFKLESSELSESVDLEDEEKMLNFLLPYKKNSRNKTANGRFITEIFSSEVFRQDYVKYLSKFEEIFQEDNQIKIQRFADYLMTCVKTERLDKIRNYKRLPWLKVWEEPTKIIAFELYSSSFQSYSSSSKKLKD